MGWVTFLGGGILWIHLSKAGLPAAEAVAKVPTSVLIATGAEFLALAVVAAIAAIGALFILDEILERRATSAEAPRRERLRQAVEEARAEVRRSEAALADRKEATAAARTRLQEAERVAADAHQRQARGEVDEDFLRAEDDRAQWFREQAQKAHEAESSAQHHLDRAKGDLERREERYSTRTGLNTIAGWRLIIFGLCLFAATLTLALVFDFSSGALPDWGWLAIAIASAVVGLIGALLFLRTASFPIFALFSLVAVPLVFALSTYLRANNTPQVEPVALLRGDGTPFVGFFLAETSDRVFVGTFMEEVPQQLCVSTNVACERDKGVFQAIDSSVRTQVPARLLSLPAADVHHLTVGPRLPLNAQDARDVSDPTEPRTAREWAAGTALLLCDNAAVAQARVGASTSVTSTGTEQPSPPIACSDEDVDRLNKLAATESSEIDD